MSRLRLLSGRRACVVQPERHGAITGIMKAQIDHLPLEMKGCGRLRGSHCDLDHISLYMTNYMVRSESWMVSTLLMPRPI